MFPQTFNYIVAKLLYVELITVFFINYYLFYNSYRPNCLILGHGGRSLLVPDLYISPQVTAIGPGMDLGTFTASSVEH